MCTLKMDGYSIENSATVTQALRDKFAEEFSKFDVFSAAFIADEHLDTGFPWVVEAINLKNKRKAYAVLEGFNGEGKRNAYFLKAPYDFHPLANYFQIFSCGNFICQAGLDTHDKPVMRWYKN